MKKKHFYLLLCLYILWIYSHSLMSGDVSSSESGSITNLIMSVLNSIHIYPSFDSLHFFIRKAAHFTEYAGLGFLTYFTLYKEPKSSRIPLYALSIGLIVPSIDEWIQTFTPDRNGSIYDVLLDFSGFLFGFLFIYLIMRLIQKHSGK